MGTAELTRSRLQLLHPPGQQLESCAREIALIYTALLVLTGLGVIAGAIVPALAPTTRPHPAQHGSITDFIATWTTNARVLSAPFLLTALRLHEHRHGRRLGDLLLTAIIVGNALRVGLALGRDGTSLLPYLPHLPLEGLATTLSATAWLELRKLTQARTAIVYAAAILIVLAGAAALETLATPHLAPALRHR